MIENTHTTPSIYVACLAAYNNGHLHGRWIDATQDAEEIHVEIKDILASSPVPGAAEWAIHDFEGFGDFKVSEWEKIETISELAAAIDEHGELIPAIMDWKGCDVEAAIETLQDDYHGEHDGKEEFAMDWHEQCGSEIPDWLSYYVDWQAIARDMFMDGFHSIELNGTLHVFSDR